MFDEASEDQLLLYGLASLGAMVGGERGARGVARGARMTKKDVRTAVEEVPGTAEGTRTSVRDLFAGLGRLAGEEAHDDGSCVIRAVIGSGFGRLNPTVVTAEVISHSQASTQISLRAAAREGLIKQHSAGKALARIIERLRVDERSPSSRHTAG